MDLDKVERPTPDTSYRYETRDPHEVEAFVRRVVAPSPALFSRRPSGGRLLFESTGIDGLQIQLLEAACAVRAAFAPDKTLLVLQLLAGQLHVETSTGGVDVRRGESHLLSLHEPSIMSWADARVGIVGFDLREVEQVAADLNRGNPTVLTLEPGRPKSPEAEQYWQAAVRMVNRDVLTNAFAKNNQLLGESLGRWLAGNLLLAWSGISVRDAMSSNDPAQGLPPATLRRAVSFIHERAADAIDMGDIAAAAGVSSRSLQYAFRRRWNLTPTEYLRHVRLERAHRDLQQADLSDGVTVAEVAARWGFANPGRFAAKYREIYGLSPYSVLRS